MRINDSWAWAAGWHEECQDNADTSEASEHEEDRVDGKTGCDEKTANQRAADAAEPAKSSAPRDARATNTRRKVIGNKPVNQRLRAAGADADKRN